jgi:DNA-binding transcriptional LysR family regulator
MDWTRLDLNLLKTLAVLLEERSVARAADRLHVTASAVSHALARLRRLLGDPLFVRAGNALAPTTRARAIEGPLLRLLPELGFALTGPAPAPDRPSTRRTLTLAVPAALDLTLIPSLAERLRREAPGWTVSIEAFQRRSYEADLLTGRVDFVASVGGHTPAGETVSIETLWEDEVVAIAGEGGPLAPHASETTLTELLDLAHLYPLPWPTSQNYLDVWLARQGRHRQIALALPSYAGVAEVLLRTDLVAMMPDRTAAALLRQAGGLRILRIVPALRSQLSLEWRRRDATDPDLTWVRRIIAEAAAAVPRGVPADTPG